MLDGVQPPDVRLALRSEGDFHALWNRGNEETGLRFLQEDDPATSQSKLALARAVAVVISSGLGILGVTPAEEMR